MLKNKNIDYIRKILALVVSDKKKLPLMLAFFLFSSALDVMGIGLIAPYVSLIINPDEFITGDIYAFLMRADFPNDIKFLIVCFGIGLLLVFIFKSIAAILINRKIISFCFAQEVSLRKLLMDYYQNQPYCNYIQRNTSEYVYNIQDLTAKYSQTILRSLLTLVSEGIVAVIIFLFLAWHSGWALALLMTMLVGLVFGYGNFFRKRISKYGKDANYFSVLMMKGLREGLAGIKEIKILGKENYFHEILSSGADKYAAASIKSQVIIGAPRYFMELVLMTFVVLLVLGATFLLNDTSYIIGTLSMFAVASMRLAPSANQVIAGITSINFGRDTVDILKKDIDSAKLYHKDKLAGKDLSVPGEFSSLELKNVSFSYDKTKKNAINDVTMTIRKGEAVGLLGESGSGKTTLIDIMLGLLEADSGQILYNDIPISDCLAEWRAKVAYLPQNIFLIDDKLMRNITLANDDEINSDKLKESIQKAKLKSLVDSLPKKIEQNIGEEGVCLSGGQRQRIALARAFYFSREILIMDESTSALDSKTEMQVVEEIRQLRGKITMIVIAHRLSTLQHCDCVYHINNGEIVNQGKYKDVVSKYH